jgi:hypothetical protein
MHVLWILPLHFAYCISMIAATERGEGPGKGKSKDFMKLGKLRR